LPQGLLGESFTSKWWLSSKVEAWNFSESERNYSIKKRLRNGRLMDDALKTRVITISMLRLGCCLPLSI